MKLMAYVLFIVLLILPLGFALHDAHKGHGPCDFSVQLQTALGLCSSDHMSATEHWNLLVSTVLVFFFVLVAVVFERQKLTLVPQKVVLRRCGDNKLIPLSDLEEFLHKQLHQQKIPGDL